MTWGEMGNMRHLTQAGCPLMLQHMPEPVEAVATETFPHSVETVFLHAVPADLVRIMKPHFPVPGVARVEDQTGAWDGAGQSRRIYLTDGSSVHEELTEYIAPQTFAYRVSNFTGFFGRFIEEARGRWIFSETSPGNTSVEWTYAFYPKNVLGGFIAKRIVLRFWRRVMLGALAQIKEDLSTGSGA